MLLRRAPTARPVVAGFTMIREMTTHQLADWMRSGEEFVLIDVLSRGEHARDHIPGSRNLPVSDADFVNSVAAEIAGDPERPIVVYGTGESCDASMQAAGELQGAGFTNVYEYKGGLEAWHREERAGELERPTKSRSLAPRRNFNTPRGPRQKRKGALAPSALRASVESSTLPSIRECALRDRQPSC